jgi:hypothetical protein
MSDEKKETTPAPEKNDGSKTTDGQDLKAEIAALKEQLAKLAQGTEKKDDASLLDKVRQDRADKEKQDSDTQALERALTFNLSSKEFLKAHEAVLPSEVQDLFTKTDKEKFDTPIQKAQNLKAGIMQSFFSVQSNLDLLTATQKKNVEDFFKLSQNGREQKADTLFENVFEPTVEMLKRVKRAEELAKAKAGYGTSGDAESAYKQKLVNMAKKRYLGEKANA